MRKVISSFLGRLGGVQKQIHCWSEHGLINIAQKRMGILGDFYNEV